MNHSIKVGFNFGVTSAVITTMGLIIGLNSATSSRLAVLGGIITIAIADACSDALGIHISEEGEGKHTKKQVWQSTISTFIFKFIFSMTFIIPFLFFSLNASIIISVVYGFMLLTLFSYKLALKEKSKNPINVVLEHITIAIVVVIITYFVGILVGNLLGA